MTLDFGKQSSFGAECVFMLRLDKGEFEWHSEEKDAPYDRSISLFLDPIVLGHGLWNSQGGPDQCLEVYC